MSTGKYGVGTSGQRDENETSRVDKARENANEAIKDIRTLYYGFLTACIYILITSASTTHMEILVGTQLKLPILNVEMPLTGFYIVAPLVLVVIHVNLLLHHEMLAIRLKAFHDAATALVSGFHPDEIVPDPFSDSLLTFLPDTSDQFQDCLQSLDVGNSKLSVWQRLLRFAVDRLRAIRKSWLDWLKCIFYLPERGIRALLKSRYPTGPADSIVWTSLKALPVVTLLVIQVKFLPYHSPSITIWHQILLIADIFFILLCWERIVRHSPGLAKRRASAHEALCRALAIRGFIVGPLCSLVALPSIYLLYKLASWLWKIHRTDATFSDVSREGWLFLLALALWVNIGLLPFVSDIWIKLVPGRHPRKSEQLRVPTRYLSRDLMASILIVGFSILVGVPGYDLSKLAGANQFEDDLNILFGRNLELSGETFIKGAARDEKYSRSNPSDPDDPTASDHDVKGIDLDRRDLRNADLSGTTLTKVILNNADLRNADLTDANLCGAIASHAMFQATKLEHANLSGAKLDHATFYGADLDYANLEGTNLEHAHLDCAEVKNARLTGANLDAATLKGANLAGADLEGVVLRDGDIQGADFFEADLRGADLRYASTAGTSVYRSKMDLTDYRYLTLKNSDIEDWKKLGSTLAENIRETDLRMKTLARFYRAWTKAIESSGHEFDESSSKNMALYSGTPDSYQNLDYDSCLVAYLTNVCSQDAFAALGFYDYRVRTAEYGSKPLAKFSICLAAQKSPVLRLLPLQVRDEIDYVMKQTPESERQCSSCSDD